MKKEIEKKVESAKRAVDKTVDSVKASAAAATNKAKDTLEGVKKRRKP